MNSTLTNNDLTILITGVGAPGAPSIIKALRNNGERKIKFIGIDINLNASGSQLVDNFYVGPKYNSPNFIREIIQICNKTGANIIIPLVTKELNIFSSGIKQFVNKKIIVCVMPEPMMSLSNNKADLLKKIKFYNISTPQFYIANDVDSFIQAVKQLGFPNNPICFKPAESNGSRGFRILDPNMDRSEILFKQKPNSTYADYEDILKILRNAKEIPELIVMEFLPNDEYSVDMLVDRGTILYNIPRKRLLINNGISTTCITEKNDDIIEYCNAIAKCISLHGNIGIQVKLDKNNKPKILEINPRLQGSVINCVAAGVNLPYLGIKLFLGEDIPADKYGWEGIKMVRKWDEVYFDKNGHALAY